MEKKRRDYLTLNWKYFQLITVAVDVVAAAAAVGGGENLEFYYWYYLN